MIRINLLPEDQRKRGRTKRASASSGGGGVLLALVFVMLLSGAAAFGYFMLAEPYYSTQRRLTQTRAELSKLEKKVADKRAEIGDLAEIEKIARNQLEVLTILDPPDRLLWSEKLNLLSDLRPANVYIRKITLTETVIEIETAESKKARAAWEKNRSKGNVKAKQPEKVTRPQITQNLTIQGISRPLNAKANDADEQAIQSFLDYQNALINHRIVSEAEHPQPGTQREFMHGLENLQIGDWRKEKVGGQWVIAFEFKIKTKPLFREEADDSPAGKKVASSN